MRPSKNNGYNGRPSGLTVLEILIGLSAIAVIALLVVPSAHTAYYEYHVKSVADDMVDALNLARSEAANRGGIARLCPSSNFRSCRAKKEWQMGWVVFLDGNADGEVQEFELIEAVEIADSKIDIQAHGPVETAASFTLTGLAVPGQEGKPSTENGEFRICYQGSSGQGRRVVIEPDGWVISEPLARQHCEPEIQG